MPRKLSDAGYDATLMAGIGLSAYGVMAGWNSGQDWLVLMSGCAGAGLAWNLVKGPMSKRKQKYKPRFANTTTFTPFQLEPVKYTDDKAQWRAKFKERPVRDFVYQSGSTEETKLFCSIPESTLIEFVKIGRKRELNARFGRQIRSRQWQGKYRQLKIHEAWSHLYFTKKRRDKFIDPTYYSIMKILLVTGFVEPPRPGHPGNLIDPSVGELEIARQAREWWQYLLTTSTTPLSGWWGRTTRRLDYLTN